MPANKSKTSPDPVAHLEEHPDDRMTIARAALAMGKEAGSFVVELYTLDPRVTGGTGNAYVREWGENEAPTLGEIQQQFGGGHWLVRFRRVGIGTLGQQAAFRTVGRNYLAELCDEAGVESTSSGLGGLRELVLERRAAQSTEEATELATVRTELAELRRELADRGRDEPSLVDGLVVKMLERNMDREEGGSPRQHVSDLLGAIKELREVGDVLGPSAPEGEGLEMIGQIAQVLGALRGAPAPALPPAQPIITAEPSPAASPATPVAGAPAEAEAVASAEVNPLAHAFAIQLVAAASRLNDAGVDGGPPWDEEAAELAELAHGLLGEFAELVPTMPLETAVQMLASSVPPGLGTTIRHPVAVRLMGSVRSQLTPEPVLVVENERSDVDAGDDEELEPPVA